METNNHQIVDYSAVLEAQYGALGTPERAKFDDEAYAFYTSQILLDARKNARGRACKTYRCQQIIHLTH